MSKSILLSIKPEWIVKISNGEKTIEVRKKFPKDYVGWIYMYCTKSTNKKYEYDYRGERVDGKVVARFWCDKVEEIHDISIMSWYHHYIGDFYNEDEICKCSCLTWQELGNYLKGNNGYAIHISKLEIFDRPKELSEFRVKDKYIEWHYNPDGIGEEVHFEGTKPLTKAPQSWCYVEGE